jgi:hypothetical protein
MLLLALLALPITSSLAEAQQAEYAFLGILGSARRQATRGTIENRDAGPSIGIEGFTGFGHFVLEARYLQGSVADSQDIVEGELLLGYRLLDWATVKFGPHIRSFIIDGVTERWTFWETRFRAMGEVYAPESQVLAIDSYVELWMAMAGSTYLSDGFGSGRGIEGGVVIRFAGSPVAGRIGYRIDQGNVSGGGRKDTVQELILGLGFGR